MWELMLSNFCFHFSPADCLPHSSIQDIGDIGFELAGVVCSNIRSPVRPSLDNNIAYGIARYPCLAQADRIAIKLLRK